MDVLETARRTLVERDLAGPNAPVLLMVSGGSDSTALAYLAAGLRDAGDLGQVGMLHVNHHLRGADADADAAFVGELAHLLGIPLSVVDVEVGRIAQDERGNVEAIARRERYAAARTALAELCQRAGRPISEGRIFVAHTADDRIENFYMRSIVGTGPGGFRSMRYLNGQVARPLLDCSRQQLRDYVVQRGKAGGAVARDGAGALWREDATNEHTDRFRAYVRHEIVPRAQERNARLRETLVRTMNLIADEDDLMADLANRAAAEHVKWLVPAETGCVIAPGFAGEPLPIRRRVAFTLLGLLVDPEDRVENASVDAVLAAFQGGKPKGGYVANIQGNLAVSANKLGVRIEPMAAYRTRRKKT